MKTTPFVLGLLFAAAVTAVPAEDKMTSLPECGGDFNFDAYSGYLDVSDDKKLHYVLMESQNDPTTDPVLFWFNGGPGCSSMLGMM